MEIMRHVDASADRWPPQLDVVVYACTLRRWRDAAVSIVQPPLECGRTTFPSSLIIKQLPTSSTCSTTSSAFPSMFSRSNVKAPGMPHSTMRLEPEPLWPPPLPTQHRRLTTDGTGWRAQALLAPSPQSSLPLPWNATAPSSPTTSLSGATAIFLFEHRCR
uniref:Uncharacterized protein n=1 Tax=Oryza punctata TaxID=4537 RepID=A0A0E0LJF0_ORYPU